MQLMKSTKDNDRLICLWPPHCECSIRHCLENCRDCSEAEKKGLFAELSQENARNEHPYNTRNKKADMKKLNKECSSTNLKTRRLATPIDCSPNCTMRLCDGITKIEAIGQCDDGCDDSLALPRVVEAAVLGVFDKLTAIDPVTIEFALRKG